MDNTPVKWKDYFNHQASVNKDLYKINDYWSKGSYDQTLENLRTILSEKNNEGLLCLDAGAGTGSIPPGFGKSNKVVTMDLAEAMYSKGHSKRRAPVVGDLESLPFKEGVFDLVLIANVIPVLEQWKKAISLSLKALKDGGRCVIYTINYESFLRKAHQLTTGKYDWLNTVSSAKIEDQLLANNVEIVEWFYDYYPLGYYSKSRTRNVICEKFSTRYAIDCVKKNRHLENCT